MGPQLSFHALRRTAPRPLRPSGSHGRRRADAARSGQGEGRGVAAARERGSREQARSRPCPLPALSRPCARPGSQARGQKGGREGACGQERCCAQAADGGEKRRRGGRASFLFLQSPCFRFSPSPLFSFFSFARPSFPAASLPPCPLRPHPSFSARLAPPPAPVSKAHLLSLGRLRDADACEVVHAGRIFGALAVRKGRCPQPAVAAHRAGRGAGRRRRRRRRRRRGRKKKGKRLPAADVLSWLAPPLLESRSRSVAVRKKRAATGGERPCGNRCRCTCEKRESVLWQRGSRVTPVARPATGCSRRDPKPRAKSRARASVV